MSNHHLSNAEIARAEIESFLPSKGPIEFDKLNINVRHLINSTKNVANGVPLSMAALVAQYTLANFVSQFQYRILLDGSFVPTNVICFLLTGSGQGKDSTVNGQENAMTMGYNVLETHRKETGMERARQKAIEEDGDETQWRQHYKEPQPLSNSISTVEGLVSRLNNFSRDGVGMPSVYVGELGSELQTNPNITDNIRLISELFDLGNKKSKAIKDAERQDSEVNGMGMNALFVGSEDNIILDKQVSQKFRTEFITKLARRSLFVYPSKEEFEQCVVGYSNFEEMKNRQQEYKYIAQEGKAFMNSASSDVATWLLDNELHTLQISNEAQELFETYKIYTSSIGNGKSYIHKSVQLEQMHRSWKCLKLAGVYALMDLSETIEVKHYAEAMYFVEKIGQYLEDYENYASKDTYELMTDFFTSNPDVTLSLHELKKRGFITGTAGIESRIKELVKLADSFAGHLGIIKYDSGVMSFKPFEKVGDHYASYIEVSGSKEERAIQCHSGYINKQTSFAKLSSLLNNNTAYSPFKFEDGKRKNDAIISGATWVALDVDKSDITMHEMHDILSDINHHIATTSDVNNPYKFRLLLEFNNIVDLPAREWKVFGKELGKELGINIDPATFTKSQIMFGYAGSEVLSTIDEDPYDISSALKNANDVGTVFNKEKAPTLTQRRTMLDNPLETFSYAFNAPEGQGSLALYRVWKHCIDLKASREETEQLLNQINYEYWEEPLDDVRFEKTIITPMRQAYEKLEYS